VAVTDGSAQFVAGSLAAGFHPVSAGYPGGGNFLGTTNSMTILVLDPPTRSISAVPPGSVRIEWSGIPGSVFQLQHAPRFGAEFWEDTVRMTNDASGRSSFIDAPPVDASIRFYRVVSP
jgi:hypothetical protein